MNALPDRRAFLADSALGFAGLALAAMLHRDGYAAEPGWAPPNGRPHFAPKARSVIWLFMNGGVSHMESFDPKPMLTRYAGKTIAETPFADVQNPRRLGIERTLVSQGGDGRDHHIFGFSVWLAGGGIKGGVVHGATDEIGFHAVEQRHYVTDVHAIILHQLGLDSRRLELPGRKRLDIDHGQPIRDILN